MSTTEVAESSTIPENISKFTPIIFTNAPDQPEDQVLSAGREKLKKWLGRMVRITLRNKLVLVGIFSCTDHDKNLIIANCDTFVPGDVEPIAYGNVMVPGDQIVSFAVDMPVSSELDETELNELQPSQTKNNSD